MLIFIGKLSAVIAVCLLCSAVAVHFTNDYIAETSAKQKSIADALLESKFQEAMKQAEDIAMAELEKKNITAAVVTLETKPVSIIQTETEKKPAEETTFSETTIEEITETSPLSEPVAETDTAAKYNERITEFKRGGLLPSDRSNIETRTIFTLTDDEQEKVNDFLTEHYFLNGFAYAEAETNSELKEKKQLAAEIQDYIVNSLNLITGVLEINDPTALLTADYKSVIKEVELIKTEFTDKYSGVGQYGVEYEKIYSSSLAYFDRMIQALNAFQKNADDYASAANPIMAFGLIINSIDGVLLPEIMGTLESSFDIVEQTQEIFLEGTSGAWLLTREEVAEIIKNPGLIL